MIASLHNIHKGKRCFILGNGPSLQIDDLDLLQNEITFAANRIFLAFESTAWRPTYYFVADRLVAESNIDEIRELHLPKFFPDIFRDILGKDEWTMYYKVLRGYRKDLSTGVQCRSTVIEPMLQFAYFMGIREIYVIGLDFSFDTPVTTGEKTKEKDDVVVSKGERNHFHPDYRKTGEKWTYPKLDLQRECFSAFQDFTMEQGDKHIVYNASRRTQLDVFPLVNFDSLFVSAILSK